MPIEWHWESVCSADQLAAIKRLAAPANRLGFYLAGGTALAARLGYRTSEDLDFFTLRKFKPQILQAKVDLDHIEIDSQTLNGHLSGVKIQFLGFPYPMLEPPAKSRNVQVAGLLDIGLMKLSAVMSRGSKKDFVDLMFLHESGISLDRLILLMPSKFRGFSDVSRTHLLKSLLFFDDAEIEPDPHILTKGWTWKKTQTFFKFIVKRIAHHLS